MEFTDRWGKDDRFNFKIIYCAGFNPLPTNDAYMHHELPLAHKNLYGGHTTSEENWERDLH